MPTRLTARGRASLAEATAAVRAVELRMTAGMDDAQRADAFAMLQ